MQQVRTTQSTQMLPNEVVTEQQSLNVVKKLLAIAVSGITYLRGLFPEKAYGNRHVEDQKVMILREEVTCPGASQVIHWMQGCFDAIQKKYLKTIILNIYTDPENPKKVTEYYQFRFQYLNKEAQINFESRSSLLACGNTKKASILLVRKLYTLMQNLEPLPDNVCLNMKLAYYEDVTPEDYQPPGFKDSDEDSMVFEREPVKLTMGEVVTPFHTLKLDMATERQRLEQVEESVNVEEKWVLTVEADGSLSQKSVTEEVKQQDNLSKDNTEVKMSCHEEEEQQSMDVTEMDTVLKTTEDMGLKRTRRGRVASSTVARVNKKRLRFPEEKMEFEIFNSQDTPTMQTPDKKRKFSEPKERF